MIAGAACGAAGAIGLTRFMKSLLYGIDPADSAALLAACSLLVLVTIAACYIPARRATKIEPLEALRYESKPIGYSAFIGNQIFFRTLQELVQRDSVSQNSGNDTDAASAPSITDSPSAANAATANAMAMR